MKTTKKDAIVVDIAKHSLECMEKVAEKAKEERNQPQGGYGEALTHINTATDSKPAENIKRINAENRGAAAKLVDEPIIARVRFIDEDDKKHTIFISRHAPPPLEDTEKFKITSYKTHLGELAELEAGDEDEQGRLVESKAVFNPKCEDNVWDSFNTEIDIKGLDIFPVPSLRAVLEPQTEIDAAKLESVWHDESDQKIIVGVKRATLDRTHLRDQPILDKYQGKIFRMPIDSQCFLAGPPGTGKTTTLIRRLGQKTDNLALEEYGEIELTHQVKDDTGVSHKSSWMFFSPTELLKRYVKEAFNRERLAAPDENTKTWNEYRRELARKNLRLLRTSAGGGLFVLDETREQHLHPKTINDAAWYDAFKDYLDKSNNEELKADAEWFSKTDSAELKNIGMRLVEILKSAKQDFYAHTLREVSGLRPELSQSIDERDRTIAGILNKAVNTITHSEPDFPDRLREQIAQILQQLTDENTEAEDDDDSDEAVLDDDDTQDSEPQAGQSVSRRQARSKFENALKALARAKARKRQISKTSFNGMLLDWLGDERRPADDELAKLGKALEEQTRLRKFRRLEPFFLRNIAPKYKRFRAIKENPWYQAKPPKPSDIHWKELDLLILAILRIANELLPDYRQQSNPSPNSLLAVVASLQRAQILVDEATDFSQVQLASMFELAHPRMKSFFICGDINQRLTTWGIQSYEDLKFINPSIKHEKITVSYRQSQRLVDLAKDIAGTDAEDIILPNRLHSEDTAPVWQSGLDNHSKTAEWLAERIKEIERIIKKSKTIAVLVNNEEQIEPLAEKLKEHLADINLDVEACKDGKVLGSGECVRVFNLKHIKGLEFESVFFVGLDETIKKHQDQELFRKYLYVGTTRAATYLGITFHSTEIPSEMLPFKKHFQNTWRQH